MRRASTLAVTSSLSRLLLSSSEQQQYHKLFQATSFTGGYSGRWFSTSNGPKTSGGYSIATKFFLSLGGITAASVAVASSEAAYAKELIKPDLLPKDVVLYQYEACPFCNKVKGIMT